MVDGPLRAKNLVTTQSRGVMFVEYDKMELHPQLSESLSKAVKQSKFYPNLDGCVFFFYGLVGRGDRLVCKTNRVGSIPTETSNNIVF